MQLLIVTLCHWVEHCSKGIEKKVWQQNQPSVLILTTREFSVNKIDLEASTLAGPPQTNRGAGTPSYTTP